jgi:hypothetical protein
MARRQQDDIVTNVSNYREIMRRRDCKTVTEHGVRMCVMEQELATRSDTHHGWLVELHSRITVSVSS